MRRLILAFTLALLLSGQTHAAETLPTPTPTPGNVSSLQHSAKLNRLKTVGASEIDRRLSALQSAMTKIQSSSKLSQTEKQAITKQLEDTVATLTALKTKLAGETRLEDARTDVQSLIQSYRTYGLLLPKARFIASADRFQALQAQLQSLHASLEAKVSQAEKNGKDVTKLREHLTKLDAALKSAQTKQDQAVAKALALAGADYTTDYKALRAFQSTLKSAHTDLKTAHDEAKTIIEGLKGL